MLSSKYCICAVIGVRKILKREPVVNLWKYVFKVTVHETLYSVKKLILSHPKVNPFYVYSLSVKKCILSHPNVNLFHVYSLSVKRCILSQLKVNPFYMYSLSVKKCILSQFKGTVQRDFRHPVFFIIQTVLGHWPMG